MPNSQPAPRVVQLPPVPSALARALEKNTEVQAETDRVATEMTVINTVLRQEIPAHVQAGDVAQALEKNGEMENRIQKSADELTEVSRMLQQELHERTLLEHELARTRRRLADAEQGKAPAA
jgi:C4-dicarboxylate-specific signal transduction histidine kinase